MISKIREKKKSAPGISKKMVTVFIIVVCIVIILCIKFFIKVSSVGPGMGALAKVKGDAKAPVQITEFIDFQCPPCAKGSRYLKKFMKEHPGMLRVEAKHYPLKMHNHAILSARYAECAAMQDKFWPFHDYLVELQRKWARLDDVNPMFEFIAKKVGLDLNDLTVCLQDDKVDKIIQKNKAKGSALGVKTTPTYFINGKMVTGTKSLKRELEKLLDERKN